MIEAKTRLGRYVITGRLGQGGMGVVYEAEDTLLKRQVALKLLPDDVATDPEALKRLLREGQSAARLNHPNVVAVYDIGESDGKRYIVMELVNGGSAQDFLQTNGRFEWKEATSILIDVCRGVMAAHKAGLIHRDIKPANILRSREGIVKLGDFGLVKAAGRKGTVVTTLGTVKGTPHYMSPEQGQSARVDERSDVYSLGATYFTLLTGRPPYTGTDPLKVMFAHHSNPIPDPCDTNGDIPQGCTALIRKAMAKNRAQRYADVASFSADLQEILRSQARSSSAHTSEPLASFAWCKPDLATSTNRVSIADLYPGERTTAQVIRRAPQWKIVAAPLCAVVLFALVAAYLVVSHPRNDAQPKGTLNEDHDWPSLAAAADEAIRSRRSAAMKGVFKNLQILQKRQGQATDPAERAAVADTLSRLEKAIRFRESITEKGLILGTSGLVSAVAFSLDDHWLGVGNSSAEGGVAIIDSWTGAQKTMLARPRNNVALRVQALAFSNDSKMVAAAGTAPVSVKVFEVETGVERSLALDESVTRVHSLAFSPNSRSLVAGLEPPGEGFGRSYMKIWDVDNGRDVFAFKAEHRGTVVTVAYSGAGQQIVSGSRDKRVIMWDAATGRIWRELHTEIQIQALACAPRGGTLAVAGRDARQSVLQIWDYAADRLLVSLPISNGVCAGLAYSPDGSLLAGSAGSDILIWNADTHAVLATLKGHSQDVASLAFAGRGGILASGSADQTMRLWDVSRLLPAP